MAKALGDLERKLGELERELAAVGSGRLVDEAAEAAAPAQTESVSSTREQPQRATAVSAAQHAAPSPTATAPAAVEIGANSRSAAQVEPSAAETRASAYELLQFRERLEQSTAELTREYDRLLGRISFASTMAATTTQPVQTISFARGAPSLDIVDIDGLKEAAARAFANDPAGATAYGTAIGYPKLRAWIADKHRVAPENVLVTNGSMQADAFLFEELVGAGDEVVVERPTYDRTLLSLRKRGALVHAVELEPDGIDTAALTRLLEGESGAKPKLAHVIPNFQNPAGYTLSAAKRSVLLSLAAEHGFVVFEDDPYAELRFTGEPLATMISMDPDHVVYASSFSKTVCPGIRVGYLVGPKDLIASVTERATNTYISPNMTSQAIVYEFCVSGAIERSIATVKHALAQRARALAESLDRELPEAEFVAPDGGYFMWVTLPQGTDVSALFSAAAERGVSFVKGSDFVLEGGTNALRLAYSGVTPEQIEQGVRRLADAYRSLPS